MLELEVNGKQLDIYRDTTIPFELNNFVFQGVNELFNSYSFNFVLPRSKNNQRILGFADMLDSDSDAPELVCTVLWNGIEIFKGDLVMEEPGTGDYEVNLQGKLKTELNNLELQMGIPAYALTESPLIEVDNTFWEGIINSGGVVRRRGRGTGYINLFLAFPYVHSALSASLNSTDWEFELNWDADLNLLLTPNFIGIGRDRITDDFRKHFPNNTTYLDTLEAMVTMFCLYVQPDVQNKKILVGHCKDLLGKTPQLIKDQAPGHTKINYEGNKGYKFSYTNIQEVALEERQILYDPYTYGNGSNDIKSSFSFLPDIWEMDAGINPRAFMFYDASDDYAKYTGPNFSLQWPDLVTRFWTEWLDFLASTKLVKKNLYLTATELAALDFTRPVHIDGFNFFVKQLRTNIKANHDKRLPFVVQAELLLIK